MSDFLFRGTLEQMDPVAYHLNQWETERQYRKLILIASESTIPMAVRAALDSPFSHIYAEGYPPEETRRQSEEEITSCAMQLADYRRNSDLRYYKGVEYCNIVEALARRRCAELFATPTVPAENLFVNVQALSGGPANNAVFHALVEPGDVVMGLTLTQGGHLSHGASVNRSGRYYNSIPYTLNPETEQLDYEAIADLARQHRPKIIIAGYSSYPWAADWAKFRAIADEVGAYLLADIAHVASLVAAGEYPSPVGIADVVTFTTHKSLNGPRGAVILTHRADLAPKIDKAVFPGEQGGPHLNTILGMAVGFKINQSQQFRQLQSQIRRNAVTLATELAAAGFRIPYGGTNTHIVNLDCSAIVSPDGTTLRGDAASRILDLAGIVVNRNTLPGDTSAFNPSGIRLGTGWMSQRGAVESDMRELAHHIATLLHACRPFHTHRPINNRKVFHARVDFETFNRVKMQVRDLALRLGIDSDPIQHGYPHFYYLDDPSPETIEVLGDKAQAFLQALTTSPIAESGEISFAIGTRAITGRFTRLPDRYQITVPGADSSLLRTWLRDASDGYIVIDEEDWQKQAPGPVIVL